MLENRACAVHNFRWRRPDGRVSWTYRTRLAALSVKRWQPTGSVLEASPDNGGTWAPELSDSDHADRSQG